jgi:hypothetical protein
MSGDDTANDEAALRDRLHALEGGAPFGLAAVAAEGRSGGGYAASPKRGRKGAGGGAQRSSGGRRR